MAKVFKNQDFDILQHSSKYYGYSLKGQVIIVGDSFKIAKRTIKTLSDLTGRNLFMLYFNHYNEIYYVREIRSVQHLIKKGVKK